MLSRQNLFILSSAGRRGEPARPSPITPKVIDNHLRSPVDETERPEAQVPVGKIDLQEIISPKSGGSQVFKSSTGRNAEWNELFDLV